MSTIEKLREAQHDVLLYDDKLGNFLSRRAAWERWHAAVKAFNEENRGLTPQSKGA